MARNIYIVHKVGLGAFQNFGSRVEKLAVNLVYLVIVLAGVQGQERIDLALLLLSK